MLRVTPCRCSLVSRTALVAMLVGGTPTAVADPGSGADETDRDQASLQHTFSPAESGSALELGLGMSRTLLGLTGLEITAGPFAGGDVAVFLRAHRISEELSEETVLHGVTALSYLGPLAEAGLTRALVGGRVVLALAHADELRHQIIVELPLRAELRVRRSVVLFAEIGLVVELIGDDGRVAVDPTGSASPGVRVSLGRGEQPFGAAGVRWIF